ncbi:MAG: hypothetical protein ACLQVG_28960 [Terriglobia bacterium]
MLPFYLPNLLWWQWLLCSVGAALVANVSYVISISGEARRRGGAISTLLILLFGTLFLASIIAAFVCAGLAVMTFANVKWFG